jgi:anaerobic magnesium-protoporphyrin IX monomethyl ester cyclase
MRVLLVQCLPIKKYPRMPPLGLGYIATCLEKAGHKVKIIFSSELKNEIKSFNPEVLGISSITQFINDALNIVELVKEHNPNCLTVLGGAHPTVMAKEILQFSPFVDVIVRGEGEITFVDLLEKFEKKGKSGFYKVNGITFRKDGRIFETNDRALIEELDSIPFPAFHLLSIDKYIKNDSKKDTGLFKVHNQDSWIISTCRGCPYNCIFCSSRAFWGLKWRSRSPENIVEELKILRYKYGIKSIEFIDDTFTLDKKRVIKFSNLIKKEKIDISSAGCATRVNFFDKEIADALKKAGYTTIGFGIESGVQKTINFLKKDFTIDEVKHAVKIAKTYDFEIAGNFIIGIPGETKKDILQTIKFAKKLALDRTAFLLLVPFPGTEIYDTAKKNDWLLTNDFSQYYTYNPVMNVPGFTNRELKGYLYFANLYYHFSFSPLQLFQKLYRLSLSLKYRQNF